LPEPTKSQLIREIGAVLGRVGAGYAGVGQRDKHYGVWLFAGILDAAPSGSAVLYELDPAGRAEFRGKPADLDEPSRFTFAVIEGARRRWELHVDLNLIGLSGARHGVDVVLLPEQVVNRARQHGRTPVASSHGLGVEAKCFNVSLSPTEGRVALGFHGELEGVFWLASNRDNQTVRDMLSVPGRKTAFFGDLRPGTTEEARFRAAAAAHLDR
jgi:hypothetical protein